MIDLPPANLDAEKAVLGAALITKEAARWAATNLEPRHFYADRNRTVIKAIQSLVADNEIVDFLSVSDRMKPQELTEFGGRKAVMELTSAVATADSVEYNGREVLRHYFDREMINLSIIVAQSTRGQDSDARDKALEKMREISRNRDGVGSGHIVTFDEAIEAAISEFDKGPGHLIPTGIEPIDRIITGLDDGDLMVVAGRPGAGKTVTGLNIGVNMAVAGKRVAFFSGEMKAKQIINRVLSSQSGVDHWRIRARKFEAGQVRKIMDGVEPLRGIPLAFFDKSRPNLRDIASFSDSYKADVVIVDYLTQCDLPKAEAYRLRVAEFMTRLKALGRDSNRRTILMAQLNRLTDREPDRRPVLSDLSESGSIEQCVDFALFIYQTQEEKNKDDSMAEFIIAKGRGTAVGVAEVAWHRPTMRLGNRVLGPSLAQTEAFGKRDHAKAAAGDVDDESVPF